MKRRLLLAGAITLTVASTASFPGRAMAAAPNQEGWWTSANTTASLGVSGTGTPAPPDVPSGALLVEGGPGSVTGKGDTGAVSYAALLYDFGQGESLTTLTLTVARQSVSTPTAILQLCPLTVQSFKPAAGGPMSDAPPYDCTASVTATQTSNAYQFNVSSLAANGALAIAILPTSAADRVVLSKPDDQSLQVQSNATTTTSTPPSTGGDSPDGGPTTGPNMGTGLGTAVGISAPSDSTPSDFGATPNTASGPALAETNPTLSRTSSEPSTSSSSAEPSTGSSPFLRSSRSSDEHSRSWIGLLFLAGVGVTIAAWASASRPSRNPTGET